MPNPLVELSRLGQSVWYDQMHRSLLTGGSLGRMIEEDSLEGLTSNPTIFEKAIGGSDVYDQSLRALALEGGSAVEIYEALALEDIAGAADAFRPLYDRTHGAHGYVSLEVDPRLARDTAGTIAEAIRHFKQLGRPNVMIKIPATPEGIPAIREAIAAGLNVNVTLIFSRQVYAQVIDAYILGLEQRLESGRPIDHIASVASFFVSRIDNKVDKEIEERIAEANDPALRERLERLEGTIAIANAKMAYRLFRNVFEGERFAKLRENGARVQRPLWASTSTKNPAYRDVLYVETLIGRDTVNTLPPATFEAFRDHGVARLTIEENLDEAERQLEELEELDISLDRMTGELTVEGVRSFADSFASLLRTIEMRRDVVLRGAAERERVSLGPVDPLFREFLVRAARENFAERLWKHDATLWSEDQAVQAQIHASLGWVSLPDWMEPNIDEITAFAAEVRRGFEFVVLLGMGGSSLCAEVMRRSYGKQTGWPELVVLDSVVPSAIAAVENRIRLDRTLFIIASKSGTTIEPNCLYRYFLARVEEKVGGEAGRHFVAITDVGTELQKEASDRNFARIFVNPSDIGGRYSALSYFGMVPAALMGVDPAALLERARHAMHACAPAVPAEENPGVRLGCAIAAAAEQGRDKLTLLASPPVESLGLWIEQLVAESTGKEGKGIIPITGEPLIAAEHAGIDRLFVSVTVEGEESQGHRSRLDAITAAGHPLVELVLKSREDLADQFYLWEFATAVAGAFLRINPFDQPNVQEAKDETRKVLDLLRAGESPGGEYRLAEKPIEVWGGKDFLDLVPAGGRPVSEVLAAHLRRAEPGGYVGLLAYLDDTPEHEQRLGAIRTEIVLAHKVATTIGFGPRYLHSTGQLHKGGPANGIFIQITAEDSHDREVPGADYSFGTLRRAQALGDFLALEKHGRKVIRVDLGRDPREGLDHLLEAVREAVSIGT
ncbi:MAG TPA: bifunctional transaldolase/phosoglucose isomerase [Thermoanaerobaculia bacterium]|nr:bifunctional transaldolase/phosoglucose isomerase [Thermoanaerobaculia bacterium]